MVFAASTQPGALGNWPANQSGMYGAGLPAAPPGYNQITSTLDPAYKAKLDEASRLLGPPPEIDNRDFRARFPRSIALLPELWAGKGGEPISNPYLTESIVFFMDDTMRELVLHMAPVQVFEGNPVVSMSVLYFNRAKVDEYMHLGVPRLVSHEWDSWSTSIQRHGLGGEFDEEVLGTKKGTELVRATIKQIQIAIMDYCGGNLIYKLLTARAQPRDFYEAHDLPLPNTQVAARMFEKELEMWGCMQKTPYALAKLAAYATDVVETAQGTKPDTVIMPKRTAEYVRFSRPELTMRSIAGDVGVARQEAGANAVMKPQLPGLTVLPAPLIPNSTGRNPYDPLVWIRQIGEFFVMDADWHEHIPWAGIANAAEKQKKARSIFIHDNESDSIREISIDRVQKFLLTRLPPVYQSACIAIANARANLARNPADAVLQTAETKAVDDLRHLAGGLDTAGNMILEFLLDHSNYHVVLARPNMTYQMGCFIFAKSGGATATTHVGYGDARWGRDATRKMALLHYTGYAGVVVTRPNNVFVANCVDTVSYLRGGGVEFADNPRNASLYPILVDKTKPEDAHLAKYSSFMGLHAEAFKSLLRNPLDGVLSDIASWARLYDFKVNPTGQMYNSYYTRNYQAHNARVFRGPSWYPRLDVNGSIVDPMGNELPGRGHWGPFAYNGVGAARCGRGPTPWVRDPTVARVGAY